MPLFPDLLSALTDPAGSLYYHWFVSLSLLIAFVAAYSATRRDMAVRPLALATGGLLLLRAIYAIAVLALLTGNALNAVGARLAVVEEGIEAIGVALILWGLSPLPSRRPLRIALLLMVVVLFSASLLAFLFLRPAPTFSFQVAWWSGWQLLVLAWAALSVLLRRPASWAIALAVVLALLAGHVTRLLSPPPIGAPAAALRLAQLVAFALLALFAVRRVAAIPGEPAATVASETALAQPAQAIAPRLEEVSQAGPEGAPAADVELRAELERAREEAQKLLEQLQELDQRASRDRQLLLEMGKLLEMQLAAPPAQQEAELAQLRETLMRRDIELADLRERLARFEGQGAAPEGAPAASPGPPDAAAMAAMARQLRQPLAVIAGYTHLIVNESLGPLDPRQKRFLERAEENVMRLTQLLDELVQSEAPAPPETAQVLAPGEPGSAVEAIEVGISRAGADIREKRITLKMDIADSLPSPRTDYRTLSEIVSQLLSHACLTSPADAEVGLIARPEYEPAGRDEPSPPQGEAQAGLLIRIRSQVETEQDLSAITALVEQHGGRMWLETEADARVANILLPVNGLSGDG